MSDPAGQGRSSPKLNIAYLFQQFPIPTETFAVSDIAALIALGHKVTAYTMKFAPRDEAALRKKIAVPAELDVVRPSLSGMLSWPRIAWRWRREISWLLRQTIRQWHRSPITYLQAVLCMPRVAEIAESIVEGKFDVVHAFWSRHVGLVLSLLERRGAPQLRTTFVGAYDLVADDFITDIVTRSAETLFSHAEVNRPYLERKAPPGATLAIIHRGIPLAVPASEPTRDPFQLVTASALVPAKNVEMVIKSFAAARERIGRLKLDVYGEGPDRARLEEIARSHGCSKAISFNGHIARNELFAKMQASRIFLLLSKKPSERLPNVVKEALWAGCGVISSRSEGIEELIPNSSIGLIVDPDDPDEVGGALLKLLEENRSQESARREKARSFISANFSSEGSMRRYVQTWEAGLNHPESQLGPMSGRPSSAE